MKNFPVKEFISHHYHCSVEPGGRVEPHTEYLIKFLCNQYKVAVLSRGYKRHTKGYVLATPESTARSIGDEPYQMHQKFPFVTVAFDEKRCHGIEKLLALQKPSIDVILLDDAFQHRYVKPGLSILLTDYHRLFCDDTLLPAGRLREPISGKNRAQIVIVTKCPQDIKPIDYNIITKRLNLYPYQQLFFSSFRYGNLQPVFPTMSPDTNAISTNHEVALSSLTNTDILLMTGIASPAPILERLEGCTKQIDLLSFDDHHNFTHQACCIFLGGNNQPVFSFQFMKPFFDKLYIPMSEIVVIVKR